MMTIVFIRLIQVRQSTSSSTTLYFWFTAANIRAFASLLFKCCCPRDNVRVLRIGNFNLIISALFTTFTAIRFVIFTDQVALLPQICLRYTATMIQCSRINVLRWFAVVISIFCVLPFLYTLDFYAKLPYFTAEFLLNRYGYNLVREGKMALFSECSE